MSDKAEAKDKKSLSLQALRPLVPYVLRYKGQIVAGFVALVVAAAATLVLPLALRQVIDHGFSQADSQLINSWFGSLLGVVSVLALASASRYYLVTSLGERVVADVRDVVFRHLIQLDISFFDTTRTGELMSRLTADTTQVKTVFGVSLSIALRSSLLFVGSAAMMVWTSPWLSALVMIAIPVIVLPLVLTGRSVRRQSRNAQDRLADAAAFAAEAINAVRTMQAYTMEQTTADRFKRAAQQAYFAARGSIIARSILSGMGMFLVSGSVVAVLWYGARDVLNGGMSTGVLSQFVFYAVLGASSLGQISEVYGELVQAAGAAERLGEILTTTAAVQAPKHPVRFPEKPVATVDFDRVSFSYPTRPEKLVLEDITFTVATGERIAIVGPSGAGKSTIFQLLLRFYDPLSGLIKVDDIAINTVTPTDLRSLIATVSQEPVIFAGSVADNIAYGSLHRTITRAEIEHAATLAAANDFIQALPDGYDTVIGERGVDLSGGQKQRLNIARAILKNAPILLLDEATSALDSESENQVQEALDTLMAGRTTLVIAHRLSTIRSADRILVIDQGRIVEQGQHDALIARDGLYARLAKLQFSASEQSAFQSEPAERKKVTA